MEGEINNFILVWAVVLISLCYCVKIGRCFSTSNFNRALAILPVVCLFCLLPLNLTTVSFGGTTSFFIAWLANFKLLLFAFGQGPLYSNPPLPLSRFISLACLPIKHQEIPESDKSSKCKAEQSYSSQQKSKKSHKSLMNYASKIMILLICVVIYQYDKFMHQKIMWLLYCLHLYTSLELLLAMVAAMARALTRLQLEPQFDEPYLATSLQDFWGRRWNLMVSNILRPTVYNPICSFYTPMAGRKWAALPAVVVTFLVSGLMHELIFYNIGRLTPTGEVTCFFLISGMSLAVEIGIKRLLKGRFLLPNILSGAVTLVFLVFTSFWLFWPPLLRGKADVKICTEVLAVIEFVKSHRLVSPDDLSCPFL